MSRTQWKARHGAWAIAGGLGAVLAALFGWKLGWLPLNAGRAVETPRTGVTSMDAATLRNDAPQPKPIAALASANARPIVSDALDTAMAEDLRRALARRRATGSAVRAAAGSGAGDVPVGLVARPARTRDAAVRRVAGFDTPDRAATARKTRPDAGDGSQHVTPAAGSPVPREHPASVSAEVPPSGRGNRPTTPEPETRANSFPAGTSPGERPADGSNPPDTGISPRSIPDGSSRDPQPLDRKQASTATLAEIDRWIARGDDLAALRALSKIYWQQPQRRPEIQTRLDTVAGRVFFAPQPHYLPPYVVQPGDVLERIARKYSVSWQYLARLNRVDPRRIRSGQKLKVIRGPFAAFVDLSEFELTVHLKGYYVKRYPVGIGRDGSSPIGRFVVRQKVENPQYTTPEGQVIAADDPANPVGEYWIDIGDGYGIHGTIDPESIGRAASRGCIRLRNDDIAEVFSLLVVGSEVVIRR